MDATTAPAPTSLRRRLFPLYIGVALQGTMLWVPVEKLFMSQIGFTPLSIGLMAAAYAVVTPLLEVPSGILADRWSRRGVMIISAAAFSLCSLVGALSSNVALYVVSALILGIYFAMYSGTVESIVYDTVLEETGSSALFQTRLGRARMIESAALVVSALAGGWLAELTSPRLTYAVTVPFGCLAIVAYMRFREPSLHKAGEPTALRAHIGATYNTILRRRDLLPIVLLGALTGLTLQMIFEFGPLWLVAMAAPTILFGPYWASVVSALGVGGFLAGRAHLDRPAGTALVAGAIVVCGTVPNLAVPLGFVIVAHVGLAVLVVVVSIQASNLLHDAVPSTIRAGVASGVGTLSWLGFLPLAVVFGWLANRSGVQHAGWILTGTALGIAWLLVKLATRPAETDHEPELPPAAAVGAAAL